MNYFKTEEFIIEPSMRAGERAIPLHVIDKIWTVHIPILNEVRFQYGKPIIISENSGYRSREWEIRNSRSGKSEHTFRNLGAVDVTCDDLDILFDLLTRTNYKRICRYETFIHCDMQGMHQRLFTNTKDGWKEL
jgi:hypothetical protein